MFDFLFQMHELTLFALLGVAAVIFSIFSVLLVNRFVPEKLRYAENPVLGNMSAMISIIYGVLAGLIALYLINNISDTSAAVLRETNAIANIYRDSKWLAEPTQTKVQNEIKVYLERVIDIEWPQMKLGAKVNHDGDRNIDIISEELKKYNLTTHSDMVIMPELLTELKALNNAREDRIAASYDELNPEVWAVIVIGTILTLVINYLYGMHLYLHLLTVSAASLMAFSMIFLLLTLDRPFQGQYVIEPDAFRPLLEIITKNS